MQNLTNNISGHLVDIDNNGKLRLRKNYTLRWNEKGKIQSISPSIENVEGCSSLIFPGFIDCHIHFPQTNMIGGYGKDLLDWLDRNVWPEEKKFSEIAYAQKVADRFFKKLFSNGTTTALVFGSQFSNATELLFELALSFGMSLITGPTIQDRNTVPELESSSKELKRNAIELIEKWHGIDRIKYAVTPRFTPSCSPDLLRMCESLLDKYGNLYLQTHINESKSEIEFVKKLHPNSKDYLETYESFGLIHSQSLLAHSVHPSDNELMRMGKASCSVAHCPSSNAFLGSGSFLLQKHLDCGIQIGLGTDVGAGLSFSLWNEMMHMHLTQMGLPSEKRFQMTGERMLKAATMDGAKALNLENEIGNFELEKWADFSIVKSKIERMSFNQENLSSELFRIAFNPGERHIRETWIRGESVYSLKD